MDEVHKKMTDFARRTELLKLLREWESADEKNQESEEDWNRLWKAIEANRTSYRKRFNEVSPP